MTNNIFILKINDEFNFHCKLTTNFATKEFCHKILNIIPTSINFLSQHLSLFPAITFPLSLSKSSDYIVGSTQIRRCRPCVAWLRWGCPMAIGQCAPIVRPGRSGRKGCWIVRANNFWVTCVAPGDRVARAIGLANLPDSPKSFKRFQI